MSSFTLEFFPDASPSTFSHHSAGVADLVSLLSVLVLMEQCSHLFGQQITTSFGGRNRKCAEAFVKSGKTFPELEEELCEFRSLCLLLVCFSDHPFSSPSLQWTDKSCRVQSLLRRSTLSSRLEADWMGKSQVQLAFKAVTWS